MSNHLVWHCGIISRKEREDLNGHKGVCLWFTGLSGSGKSTLAAELESRLYNRGIHTYVLDGDNIRHGLNSDLSFSPEDRKENIRRIGEVAKLFVDAGVIVVTAFISPYRSDRDSARNLFEKGKFLEIFVDCSFATCEMRDPKGLYKKARENIINDFTGIHAPYEPPLKPELIIKNDAGNSLDSNVSFIIDYLANNGYFNI